MLLAQFGLELKLLLRNGEQLLLTMFIPITLLVGLTLLPLGSFGTNRAATFVPAIMALAVISTAFTGQAIAVAFDRRYGALKRLGATALPVWGIIAGKSLAVVAVVFLQSILLGAIGFALGWRPHIAGLALGAVIIALGTAGFAALGLLLGGTLRAEIVLAVANLLWFVFAGLGALTLEGQAGARRHQVGGPVDAVGRADRGAVAGDDAVGGLVRVGGTGGVGRGRGAVRAALVPFHMTTVLGVDACPGGWVGVKLRDGDFAAACRDVLLDVVRQVSDADAVAVDIPLGLVDRGWRDADTAAKTISPRALVERIHDAAPRCAGTGYTRPGVGALPRSERRRVQHSGVGIENQTA